MKIILISGKARNGKDTAAKILKHRLECDDYKVLITHYADLLKFICTNYFGWNGIKDDEGRQMLQYVGTDVIREKNPTLWVDFVSTILSYFPNEWDYVVIPDCRFPNEITRLCDKGFDVTHLKIIRDNFESHLTEEQKNHPSETALDNTMPDYCIFNDGTLEDLKALIIQWYEENLI